MQHMKWPLVLFFVGCMIACGWMYDASPKNQGPAGPRMGYAVGLYASCGAALVTLVIYGLVGRK